MAKPSRATQTKRNRERSRMERAQEKQLKRSSMTEEEKAARDQMIADGVDPDLVGIVAGPQPPAEI